MKITYFIPQHHTTWGGSSLCTNLLKYLCLAASAPDWFHIYSPRHLTSSQNKREGRWTGEQDERMKLGIFCSSYKFGRVHLLLLLSFWHLLGRDLTVFCQDNLHGTALHEQTGQSWQYLLYSSVLSKLCDHDQVIAQICWSLVYPLWPSGALQQ